VPNARKRSPRMNSIRVSGKMAKSRNATIVSGDINVAKSKKKWPWMLSLKRRRKWKRKSKGRAVGCSVIGKFGNVVLHNIIINLFSPPFHCMYLMTQL
jgi:hypothetical protein